MIHFALVKTIDFRALIKVQWVLVLSLVALVSFCTTVLDLFTGKFGGACNQRRVDSTGKRTWVLDAGGGRGSGGKDFFSIIYKVSEGEPTELQACGAYGPYGL